MAPIPDTMDAKMRRRLDEDRLGRDIVDECRVRLMLKFRFLDLALWRMRLEPLRAGMRYPLATDAGRVIYDPPRVIARFQESFEETVRDYLHLVLHCIFRHPFSEGHASREAWNLACDIIAESAAMDLCGGRFASKDDAVRRQAVSEIRMLVGNLLPNKVYALVKGLTETPDGQQYRGLGRSVLNEWRALFERDDHGAWPANNDASGSSDPDRASEASEDDESPDAELDALRTETLGNDSAQAIGGEQREEAARPQRADAPDGTEGAEADAEGADADAEGDGSGDSDGSDEADGVMRDGPESASPDEDESDDLARREREWEDVAKQIEMNLETFSKEWGEEAGSLMANLSFANRTTHRYTEFLRRFMTTTEEMRLNMDEFDHIFYTYGMDLYGNMPLVEPLEYQEARRVRDFVIVIDTSESVSGELVKRFVSHTLGILKSGEDYAREVNIHLIQCDSKVQSDVKVADLRDVDRLMEGFTVRGFGGTDFRPAFDYVDMLRKRGELADLKGLIYFTDGLGQFPEKIPDYDTAFVFMDEEGRGLPPVPPWAMKVLIDEAGISHLESGAAG